MYKKKINSYKYAIYNPVEISSVQLTGGLIYDYVERSKNIGMLKCYDEFEKAGSFENYRIIAKGTKQNHNGNRNNNEFVYKWLEACGYYASYSNTEDILEIYEKMIDLVGKAQRDDGYLNTYYDNPLVKEKGLTRFDSENRFEFYNLGHLIQAGIAYFKSVNNENLLNIAVKFADLVIDKFSYPNKLPYKLNKGPLHLKTEHPNHETAFVDLYRLTGEKKYLEFAKQTLEEYDFWQNPINEGHAVQETLLNIGAIDLYLEYGEDYMLDVSIKKWDDMYYKKMYITGAIGSRYVSESYGNPYELPNDRAYAETCASIVNFVWSYKMFLATGDVKYTDCMERILYNSIISGYSLDGERYLYNNPLSFKTGSYIISNDLDGDIEKMKGGRWHWHKCPCCPPNVHRLLASLKKYIYTVNDEGIQINIYGECTISTVINNEKVEITQKTNYPWDGNIELNIYTQKPVDFKLSLRIPEWCEDAKIYMNDEIIHIEDNHYLIIDARWKTGDKINIEFAMKARKAIGNPYVTSNYHHAFVQRGPIIYCVEQEDNPNINILDILLSNKQEFKEEYLPHKLGGIVQIQSSEYIVDNKKWNNKISNVYSPKVKLEKNPITITYIPYYTWANRSICDMSVWLPIE